RTDVCGRVRSRKDPPVTILLAASSVNDFFDSKAWLVTRNLALLLLVVFWLATAFWVFKNARRRIEDRWLVLTSTALGLFPPFLGVFIYMLFRPPEYLEDVRERELEIRAIEKRLGVRECPVCRTEIDSDFLVCPVCTRRLRRSCVNCMRPLDSGWFVCPYCETPVVTQELRP